MATERLRVILEMVSGQYKREAREAATATSSISREAKTASTQTGGLTSKMSGFGNVLRGAAVVGGVTALGRGLFDAAKEAERAASAVANTNQIIKQTGGIANVTGDDITKLSQRLASMTGTQDDVVREGANVLLTFKNLRNEVGEGNDVFDRTAALMLDVGAVMGTDATSAALQLGKALNDPVSQMGALSRAGLTFSQTQKDMIKDMVANNDLLGAQKLILGELEAQLGGTAAASADATARMSSAFGEIVETIGSGLLPGLEDVADGMAILAGMSPQVLDLADTIKEIGEVNLSDLFQVGEVVGATDFEQTMRTILETADLTDDELRELADGGMAQLREEFDLSGRRAEILADIIDDQLRAGLEDSIGAANRHKKAIEEDAEAMEELGEETEDATDALQEQFDLIRGQLDPLFKLQDAANDAAEAQQAVTEAAEEFGEGSREHVDAISKAAEANLKLEGATLDVRAAADLTREGFINQQIEMGLTRAEAELLADEFERLDGFTFDPKEILITTRFQTIGGGGSGSITNIGERQHGGPVMAGRSYLVGERGPELFTAPFNGFVTSNEDLTKGVLNSSSSPSSHTTVTHGPTIYIGTVYGFDDFAAKVRDAGITIDRLGG